MTKADFFTYLLFTVIAVAGWWIHGFAGGIIFGFAVTFMIAATIGKVISKKAVTRINKNIMDLLLHRKIN